VPSRRYGLRGVQCSPNATPWGHDVVVLNGSCLVHQMRTRYSRSTEPLGTAKGVGFVMWGVGFVTCAMWGSVMCGSSCMGFVNFQQVRSRCARRAQL